MKKVHTVLPIKEIYIQLYVEDGCSRGTNTFHTVQEFAEFLKYNPDLAKAIGYEPKPKK